MCHYFYATTIQLFQRLYHINALVILIILQNYDMIKSSNSVIISMSAFISDAQFSFIVAFVQNAKLVYSFIIQSRM